MTRRLTEYGLVQAELRHQAVKKIVQIGIQWHWLRMRNQKKREVRSYYGVRIQAPQSLAVRRIFEAKQKNMGASQGRKLPAIRYR